MHTKIKFSIKCFKCFIHRAIFPLTPLVVAGAVEPEGAEGAEAVEVLADDQKTLHGLAGRQMQPQLAKGLLLQDITL